MDTDLEKLMAEINVNTKDEAITFLQDIIIGDQADMNNALAALGNMVNFYPKLQKKYGIGKMGMEIKKAQFHIQNVYQNIAKILIEIDEIRKQDE